MNKKEMAKIDDTKRDVQGREWYKQEENLPLKEAHNQVF